MNQLDLPRLELRTEAESLAIAIELGIIDVAEAFRWADRQISQVEVPDSALCDVSMSSKAHPQDVADLLRAVPGQYDQRRAVTQVLRFAFNALVSHQRTPESVSRALLNLAMAGAPLPGKLKGEAYWYDDAFSLAQEGYIQESAEKITDEMVSAISEAILDAHDESDSD